MCLADPSPTDAPLALTQSHQYNGSLCAVKRRETIPLALYRPRIQAAADPSLVASVLHAASAAETSNIGVHAGIATYKPSSGGPRPSLARKKHVLKPHFAPNPSIESKAQSSANKKRWPIICANDRSPRI